MTTTKMDLMLKQPPSTLLRENPTSLYLQIAALLREEISSGLYEPSGKLPSEAELVKRFDVSRITVRLALDQLVEEKIVERKQGKGTYVSNKQLRHGLDTLRSFHESLVIQGLQPKMRLLSHQIVEIPETLKGAFGPNSDKNLLIERLHLVDDQPIALGESHLPAEVATMNMKAIEQQPSYMVIEAVIGLKVVRADLSITAKLADEKYAKLLEIEIGMPLLIMKRLSYLSNEVCCDHSVFYIRPEHYEFVLSSYFKLTA
jgi:GntR family transcriptional regulator